MLLQESARPTPITTTGLPFMVSLDADGVMEVAALQPQRRGCSAGVEDSRVHFRTCGTQQGESLCALTACGDGALVIRRSRSRASHISRSGYAGCRSRISEKMPSTR